MAKRSNFFMMGKAQPQMRLKNHFPSGVAIFLVFLVFIHNLKKNKLAHFEHESAYCTNSLQEPQVTRHLINVTLSTWSDCQDGMRTSCYLSSSSICYLKGWQVGCLGFQCKSSKFQFVLGLQTYLRLPAFLPMSQESRVPPGT